MILLKNNQKGFNMERRKNLSYIIGLEFDKVDRYNLNITRLCTIAGLSREYFYRAWRDPEILNIKTAQKIINVINLMIWREKQNPHHGRGFERKEQ